MKIGVFGGTFDPIHIGHLIVAEAALEELGLERVLFVVAGQPYFKSDLEVSAAGHRMSMVRLAVESNPRFEASDLEIGRSGPSYTVDTLTALRAGRDRDAELYLLVGQDALEALGRWRDPDRVLAMSTVVGVPRAGLTFSPEALDEACPDASRSLVLLDGPKIGVSGSEIRRRASEGLSIKYLVPPEVEEYIYRSGLYGAKPARKTGRT